MYIDIHTGNEISRSSNFALTTLTTVFMILIRFSIALMCNKILMVRHIYSHQLKYEFLTIVILLLVKTAPNLIQKYPLLFSFYGRSLEERKYRRTGIPTEQVRNKQYFTKIL